MRQGPECLTVTYHMHTQTERQWPGHVNAWFSFDHSDLEIPAFNNVPVVAKEHLSWQVSTQAGTIS